MASPAAQAQAQGWNRFPVTDMDYRAELALAALGGIQGPDVEGVGSGGAYGVELSLTCPTTQPDPVADQPDPLRQRRPRAHQPGDQPPL